MGTEVACAATASREDLDKDGQRYISNLDQEGLLRRRRDQRLQKEGEVHLVKVGDGVSVIRGREVTWA